MEHILYNIGQVLGLTIIHSLWQALLVYFVLKAVLMLPLQLSSNKKYWIAVTAQLAITGLFIYTLVLQVQQFNWMAVKPMNLSHLPLLPDLSAQGGQFQGQNIRYYYSIEQYLPYVSIVYIAGILFNSVRFLFARKNVNAIRKTMSIDVVLQREIKRFTAVFGISRQVKIGLSKMVDVPCMVGYLKPVILLPFTLSTYLSAEEIESILLHELAHIKRNDYLVNIIQQILSILLFFNPCAQLINKIINEERENCCDDLVVNATSNPLLYAKTLLKVEQARENTLRLALAATGKKYYLLTRIERIMKTKKQPGNIRHLFVALLLLAGTLGIVAWANPGHAKNLISPAKPMAMVTNPDSDIYNSLSDTSKHKTKSGATKSKTQAKVYKKPTYHSTSADTSAFGYFDSKEWKAQMEQIKKMGEEMNKQFNSQAWKNQMETIAKQSEEMKKQFNSPEWKKQMEDIAKQSEEMKKQFNSPEWKKQMEDITKQSEEMKKQFNSPEWKKQMEDIGKQGEEIKKQFNSPEWKKQMQDIQRQSLEMQKQFNSQAWKSQTENMKKMGEQMQKQFNSPEWKKQMEEMKNMKWEWKDSTKGVVKDTVKK